MIGIPSSRLMEGVDGRPCGCAFVDGQKVIWCGDPGCQARQRETLQELIAGTTNALGRPDCEYPFCKCDVDAQCPQDGLPHPLRAK
jgi:hypothetical protein